MTSCWLPAVMSMCSAYIQGPTYIHMERAWGWGSLPNSPSIKRYYQNSILYIWVPWFLPKLRKRAFLGCPAQFYGFRSETWTIQRCTHTFIYVANVFPHFLGLVLIGREQPHYCRRLSAPGVMYTSPATCFSKSWNARLGRTMVRLRWTTGTCKYCIPVNHTTMLVWSLPVDLHQALPRSRSPSPGLCATILHNHDIPTLHTLALTTINCYCRGTDVRLVPAAAFQGCTSKYSTKDGR